MGRRKRRRGGQPGNQNARKHGFYSVNLNLQESNDCLSIMQEKNVTLDIALLRLKLNFILKNAPGNERLLREYTGLVYKWGLSKGLNSRREKTEIRRLLREFKAALIEKAENLPEPIEAEPWEKQKNRRNQ